MGGWGGDDSDCNASDGEWQIKLCSLAAPLLLCSLVPNRPRTVPVCGPGVGDPCFKGLGNVEQLNDLDYRVKLA